LTESISFDRAADYYDRTRSSDEVLTRVIPALTDLLPAGEPCLEIGIGTGRIALPLVEAGAQVVGVDVSIEMLRRLIAKRPGRGPHVAIANATRLPFADATFGGAIAAHVLHLIPGWRDAVRETVRVVRPGGVFAASRGSHLKGGWRDRVSAHFFAEAGNPAWPPGMDRIDELDVEMASIGARSEKVPGAGAEDLVSIEQLVQTMEAGVWAACWSVDETTRHRAAAATRRWAVGEFGDLTTPRPTPAGSDWRAYRLP
jgi:SAM-dependent methyltransferase